MEQANKDRSLVSKVMDGLVTGIVEEKYGAILPPQDVLSKEFDVSRTVMREALSMLLARDMLDVRPKIGTRIRPMSDWRMIDEDVVNWRFRAKPDPLFLRDVIEFRILIEPRASAQAALRGSAADIAAVRDAFEAFRVIRPEEPGYQEADELFHTRIVVASGNQFFQQMAAIIRGALSTGNPIGGELASARGRGNRTARSERSRARFDGDDRLYDRRDRRQLRRCAADSSHARLRRS